MGKKLSDQTTKRVVIVVLLIMISIPFFSSETYLSDKLSTYQLGIDQIVQLYQSQGESEF